jgi:hypothetical protein
MNPLTLAGVGLLALSALGLAFGQRVLSRWWTVPWPRWQGLDREQATMLLGFALFAGFMAWLAWCW